MEGKWRMPPVQPLLARRPWRAWRATPTRCCCPGLGDPPGQRDEAVKEVDGLGQCVDEHQMVLAVRAGGTGRGQGAGGWAAGVTYGGDQEIEVALVET